MAQRHQRGWLKKEKRAQGETWVLFFRTTRKSDGKRVENKVSIGLVRDLPDASSAWAEVERLHVPINRVVVRRGLIFGDWRSTTQNTSWLKPPNQSAPRRTQPSKATSECSETACSHDGEQNRTWYRTLGSGAVAESLEKGRASCQSDTRQDSSRHVPGV